MAFFQRRPQTGGSGGLYTLGLNKTKLLVGLGNPGPEYTGTRHNIGFACLDTFAQVSEFDPWIEKKDLKCLQASQRMGDTRVILIKPTTFMNLSGEAVQAAIAFYKIAVQDIAVVHDELDMPFGQIRTRIGGGSAGHNGLNSIIQYIGEDFGRVRVGIGPKEPEQMDSADFVLAGFNEAEQGHIKALTREVAVILSEYIYSGQLPQETRSFIV